jgi:NIMA (never in mitosis gene a)-related kinase
MEIRNGMAPKRYYTNAELLSTFKRLISFFAYMKEQKIVHRDVKLDNIFLTEDGWAKIGDFGTALVDRVEAGDFSIKGTAPYFSPAKRMAADGNASQVEEDPEKGDVWSLGICFLEMVKMERPEDLNREG